ncbi:MAG: hypothetical protein EOP48_12755 [Sphingobacteriales bacterium]|nr:MAG: hypothetical protein EOP48_12755 [Sphingobacteriales bacterium]
MNHLRIRFCTIDGKEYAFNNQASARRSSQYAIGIIGFKGTADANSDRILLRIDSDTTLQPGKYGLISNSSGRIRQGLLTFLPGESNRQYVSFGMAVTLPRLLSRPSTMNILKVLLAAT